MLHTTSTTFTTFTTYATTQRTKVRWRSIHSSWILLISEQHKFDFHNFKCSISYFGTNFTSLFPNSKRSPQNETMLSALVILIKVSNSHLLNLCGSILFVRRRQSQKCPHLTSLSLISEIFVWAVCRSVKNCVGVCRRVKKYTADWSQLSESKHSVGDLLLLQKLLLNFSTEGKSSEKQISVELPISWLPNSTDLHFWYQSDIVNRVRQIQKT